MKPDSINHPIEGTLEAKFQTTLLEEIFSPEVTDPKAMFVEAIKAISGYAFTSHHNTSVMPLGLDAFKLIDIRELGMDLNHNRAFINHNNDNEFFVKRIGEEFMLTMALIGGQKDPSQRQLKLFYHSGGYDTQYFLELSMSDKGTPVVEYGEY